MESGPAVSIFIAGLVFSFLLSALYSIVKIVFNAIIDGANPAEGDETLRYYASQAQQISRKQGTFKQHSIHWPYFWCCWLHAIFLFTFLQSLSWHFILARYRYTGSFFSCSDILVLL